MAIANVEFENSPSKINFLKDYPETRIGDRVLGPYRVGQEVEISLWIAQHLVELGYARFRDGEQLALNTLSTIAYRESLSGLRQLSRLFPSFYFQARHLLKSLKMQEEKNRSKGRDFDKALNLSRDIATKRMKKIASVAASTEPAPEITSNMTVEELSLYNNIRRMVDSWSKEILEVEFQD